MSLLMTFAEFERNVIMERSQMGVDEKIKSSKVIPYMGSQDAFGYKHDRNTKNQIIVPAEAPIVKKIFNLYFIQRMNYSQISQALAGEGIKTRLRQKKDNKSRSRGGVDFTPQTIKNMICNPIYAGKRRYTKWVEMKITLQVSAENDLVFTNGAMVRIRDKLAFPTRFELVYPP